MVNRKFGESELGFPLGGTEEGFFAIRQKTVSRKHSKLTCSCCSFDLAEIAKSVLRTASFHDRSVLFKMCLVKLPLFI